MWTCSRCSSVALLGLLLLPVTAFAQAALTGVVRDPSGGVLPGVTVEAASPALIEKVRSVTTDGTGQYRIVDLRTGTYTVTFSLEGFLKQQQNNIVITNGFTAPVNATMALGQLAETVMVTADAPAADVQNALGSFRGHRLRRRRRSGKSARSFGSIRRSRTRPPRVRRRRRRGAVAAPPTP